MRYALFIALAFLAFGCDRKPAPSAAGSASIGPVLPSAPVASASASVPAFTKPPTTARVIAWFMHSKIPIATSDIAMVDEKTDSNKLLGRPHQYTEKAMWKDARTGETGEPSLETGGTVELFANEEDAKTRFDYVDKLSATPMLAEYHYLRGPVLVRLSKDLSPSQAKEYEAALAVMP